MSRKKFGEGYAHGMLLCLDQEEVQREWTRLSGLKRMGAVHARKGNKVEFCFHQTSHCEGNVYSDVMRLLKDGAVDWIIYPEFTPLPCECVNRPGFCGDSVSYP